MKITTLPLLRKSIERYKNDYKTKSGKEVICLLSVSGNLKGVVKTNASCSLPVAHS